MSILDLYDLAVIRCRLTKTDFIEGLSSADMTDPNMGDDGSSITANSLQSKSNIQHKNMITEMRAQNYDVIRFATYRTACKLRFIQKKTFLHLVDIWNMIEAFRENGLNCVEQQLEINVSRLETILSSIYYHLNKRLPTNQQIDVSTSISLLLNWLLAAYDPEKKGKLQIFSIKVALTSLCSGKLMDKLRYIFTQISDSSGFLMYSKFETYLKDVCALPTMVFEGPSFGYNASAAKSCFDGQRNKVNVNDFLDTMMTDPAPQCLMWMPIFHRMANSESVLHPIQCEGCHRESFMGFRYKCQRCYNYHLCQDCFWRGRVSGNHSNNHEVKEYTTYKSPAKEMGRSLRKSFRCVPSHSNNRIPYFPDTPEKTLDLSHIVPATPVFSHNGINDNTFSQSQDLSSLDNSSSNKSPSKVGQQDCTQIDDEHRLIARYASRLAADFKNASRSPTELNFNFDGSKPQHELILQLEAKNREIMKEIQRLRVEQEAVSASADATRNPTLLAELLLLRQRKDELEGRMTALQESRRELMVQLEGLMKLLKSHGSPRSTPNSSPRSRNAPPIPPPRMSSSPSTPGNSLSGLGGDVQQAFAQNVAIGNNASTGNMHSLRNDLLVAADSVTNAMSSLVKELNSDVSSGSEDEDISKNKKRNFYNEEESALESTDDYAEWREKIQRSLGEELKLITEMRARKGQLSDSENESYLAMDDAESLLSCLRTDSESLINTDDGEFMKTDDEFSRRTDDEDAELYDNNPKELLQLQNCLRYTTTDDESYLTDADSYIRTDEEEGGNTDWEDNMKRWVNR